MRPQAMGHCAVRVVTSFGPRRWFRLYLWSTRIGARDRLLPGAAARVGLGGGAAWRDTALTTRSSSGRLSHLEPRSRAVQQAPRPIPPLLLESKLRPALFPLLGVRLFFFFLPGSHVPKSPQLTLAGAPR